jgi:hypothetical protein
VVVFFVSMLVLFSRFPAVFWRRPFCSMVFSGACVGFGGLFWFPKLWLCVRCVSVFRIRGIGRFRSSGTVLVRQK